MKRSTLLVNTSFLRTLGAVAIVVGSVAGQATAAFAVTNPADNPHPITVKGDDGNAYVDGQDTLPGFDDEECTYIPGAYFDFAHNLVHYADGQSIPWTEWDRASGYQDWLAKKNETVDTTPKPTPSSTPGASDPKATSGSSSSAVGKDVADKAVQNPTDDPSLVNPTAVATGEPTTTASGTETQNNELTVTLGKDAGKNPGREVGIAILGFLVGAGLLLSFGQKLRVRVLRRIKS